MILGLLKKATREKSTTVAQVSIVLQFKILGSFADSKNNYAPILYKTLVFACIENYADTGLRQLFLENFREVFTKFVNIPVHILLGFLTQIKLKNTPKIPQK